MANARRANRGPGAAVENRRALVAAAIEVFGERGTDAPLSAIARRAGVGQGSLYRHFPDRMGLALAVFEDNVIELENLARRPGTTLEDLLGLITEQAIASVALVDIVATGGHDVRLDAVTTRVSQALDAAVQEARHSGRLRHDVETSDIMLAIGMITALVSRHPSDQRRSTADACWSLLRGALERSGDRGLDQLDDPPLDDRAPGHERV